MKIIKFGGTAFQTPKLVENACEIINLESKPLVVVVSAIGRKGFPFATDTLIESIKDKKNVYIMGDFNITPSSKSYEYISKKYFLKYI